MYNYSTNKIKVSQITKEYLISELGNELILTEKSALYYYLLNAVVKKYRRRDSVLSKTSNTNNNYVEVSFKISSEFFNQYGYEITLTQAMWLNQFVEKLVKAQTLRMYMLGREIAPEMQKKHIIEAMPNNIGVPNINVDTITKQIYRYQKRQETLAIAGQLELF